MCLAVPGLIESVDGDEAVVDMQGNRMRVCTVMLEQPTVGRWVLVHAGYAISEIDADEAAATWSLLSEMAQLKAQFKTGGVS